jgi:hypothetical protein
MEIYRKRYVRYSGEVEVEGEVRPVGGDGYIL